ncbi:MAG: molybdopterin-guanine dinucleotide biosynthesis protein B, partial [Thiotrichaceae bacterium]
LLIKLIPLLKQKGIRVGLVKHAHHHFDIDHPGKDSYELRKAGATEVVIASKKRIASIHEIPIQQDEPILKDALSHIQTEHLDLVLIEGFKTEEIPKIELHRKELNKPYIYPNDNGIIAIAVDEPDDLPDTDKRIKQLDLNQPEDIVEFIQQWLDQPKPEAT